MKAPSTSSWLAAGLLASPVVADLVGYGLYPYEPVCATTCLRSFGSYMLNCTSMAGSDMMMMMMMTSPQCYASNTPFLTSVAWCMSTKCAEFSITTSELESFWEQQITGDRTVAPKWSYSQALFNVNPQPPAYQLTKSDTSLNLTSIVAPGTYLDQWNALSAVYRETILESRYSIAIIVTGVGLPLVLTWLGYLPYVPAVLDRVKPFLVYPSTIGTYQVRPLPYLLGNVPTIGQSLYIAVFVILNVILTAVGYQSRQPNAWFGSQWQEIIAYIFYRTGNYAFMLAPLVLLFSSRNNVLLWLTNWSHTTYVLLHRWVARVFTLHVVLHSILGLMIYKEYQTTQWWIWGAAATVATVILAVASGLYVRRVQYELFLIMHVLLSVFVVVGCWYHIVLWYDSEGISFPYTWGYEDWLYFAIAVWFFDRLVRVGRILKTGPRRAKVTDLGGGYVRVDIPGVHWGSEPGKHAYAYFPTLIPLRPWENHPFSVVPTPLLQLSDLSSSSENNGSTAGSGHEDAEKHGQVMARARTPVNGHPTVGVTLIIKKSMGMTKHLHAQDGLLTLLEGPYPNNQSREVLRCDRLLLIGGGIGVTGLLPWVHHHWNVKLAWSVKESARCLVEAVGGVLSGIADKDVRVGNRLSINELMAEETDAGWARVGVVVSGPGGLCDSVRAAVAAAGRRGNTVFELEVDAYSW